MTVALKHADRPHSSILPRWRDRASDHARHGPLLSFGADIDWNPILPMQTPRRSLWQGITGRQP